MIHSALPLVIVAYLFANTAYFLVLPLSITSTSTTIAVAFGSQVLGPLGSLLLALTVSGSCVGALNATIFTSSRLFYAAAKEGYLPSIFGRLGLRSRRLVRLPSRTAPGQQERGIRRLLAKLCADDSTNAVFLTPIPALLLNFGLTAMYITLGTFRTLLTFYGVAGYFFYFLTVLGLLILRVKEPSLNRPYKCFLGTPVIFCCVSLFLLSRSVVAEPWTSLAVVGFVIIGFAVGLWRMKTGSWERQKQSESVGWKFWKRWS